MSSSPTSRPLLHALGPAAAALALCLACAVPGHATSFTSSASSAGSASSGSVSDSIGSSSNSSSGDDKKVAAGEYRVIDVAQAPAKPDTTRMTLRAVDGGTGPAREFYLDVPNRALAQRSVNAGELVQVSERVYGYEFAHADTRRSFFLALQDDWYRDLGSRKVTI